MATKDHNAMIRAAAGATLGAIGLYQKGRSRLWIDDHGWWLIVVELQPSGGRSGTYCNVGGDYLWFARDHLVFEDAERISVGGEQFVGFDPAAPETFETQIAALVGAAAEAVEERRGIHSDRDRDTLQRLSRRRGDIYDDYHAGAAAGLLGMRTDPGLHDLELLAAFALDVDIDLDIALGHEVFAP